MISVSMSALADATLIQVVTGLLTPTELALLAAVVVAAVIGTLVIRRDRRQEMVARQQVEAEQAREAGGAR